MAEQQLSKKEIEENIQRLQKMLPLAEGVEKVQIEVLLEYLHKKKRNKVKKNR